MAFKMKAGKEGPMRKNFGSKYSPMNKIKDKVTTSESDLGNIVKSQKDKEMGKSDPFEKALVGNQKNLPEHLKKKIEAAPESPMQKPKVKFDKEGNVRKEKFKDAGGNTVKIKRKKGGEQKVKVGGAKIMIGEDSDPDNMQLYDTKFGKDGEIIGGKPSSSGYNVTKKK